MQDDIITVGRPCGELLLYGKKDLPFKFKQINTTSSRIIVVRAIKENIDLLLINIYMPFKNNETVNEFIDVLTKMMSIYNTYNSSDIILGAILIVI